MSRVLDTGQINPTVQETSEKGAVNGYAALDASGKVPAAQMSTSFPSDTTIGGTLTVDSNILIRSVIGSPIGDNFAGTTQQNYINFTAASGSNDPGFIMHETSATETNEGVIHLCPSDDNGDGDYVSIHGTNDADTLKLHTSGKIEGVTTLTTSGAITEAGTALSSKYLGISATAANANLLDSINSTSFLRSDAADTASSQITFSTGLARSAHNVGHLEGSYNNIGANGAQSNPIYTIGSAYNPSTTTLGNMYGIGYAHSGQASYLSWVPGLDGWGLYAAADGDARVFLNASSGQVSTTSTIYEAGTALSSKYLGISAKAADANLLDGYDSSNSSYGADSVAIRNGSGDITARLFRSNYTNETTISGAMAYRISTTDNYIRFCSDTAAIRSFLSVSEASHTHSNYLPSNANADYTGGDRIKFNDSRRIDFGSSNDWRCYHDGTHNYMNFYTGNFYLRDSTTTRFTFERTTGYGTAADWIATSDRRLKENIKPLESALSRVSQIGTMASRYNRIDIQDKSERIGFIAQEIETVYPEFVTEDDTKDKIKSVNYSKMVAPLYKAMAEMNDIIEQQTSQIEELEKIIETLSNK
jgi:hypothetical protein